MNYKYVYMYITTDFFYLYKFEIEYFSDEL